MVLAMFSSTHAHALKKFHALACCSLCLAVGCSPESGTKSADKQLSPASDAATAAVDPASKNTNELPSADSNAANIAVAVSDHAGMLKKIAEFSGRIVVVDVWSTSCPPCMKEFPHLVELAKQWPEDVVCISLNLDYIGLAKEPPESLIPKVTKFLKSTNADAPNLVHLLSSDEDSAMLSKLEIASMPAIFIYDRKGNLSTKVTADTAGSDGMSYASDVNPVVEKLVNNP